MPSTSDSVAQKEKRKAQDALNYQIAKAAAALEERMNKDMETEAKRLGVEVAAIRARFLMYASHRGDTQPTVWNGLVHVKSEEWAEMKGKLVQGRAFLAYVVERIHNEDLYNLAEMSEEDQECYIRAAQEARMAKLNAGTAKTSSQRLLQGTVKNELSGICNRLQYLHAATEIEFVLLVVKGRAQDGLAPTYTVSDKARAFIESHLKASITHTLDLFESSSIGGAGAVALRSRNETQTVKSKLRRKVTQLFYDTVPTVAEDGSPPIVTNSLEIGMFEYKNYVNVVKEYRVILKGWPLTSNGSLVDPSSMGLGRMQRLLKLLEDPDSDCGFKRLTESEWKRWSEKLEEDVNAGRVTLPTRKIRIDAGKKRRHETSKEDKADDSKQARKQGTNQKPRKPSAAKKSNSQRTTQKKTPEQIPSSDSAQEAPPDNPSDHHTHPVAPNQPVEARNNNADPYGDPLPPPGTLETGPPVDPGPNSRATFDFRAPTRR
ncbi:hypothetical protein RSAG8_03510, partial [Rhizoctonia solani AG-8 WAC10335]